MRTLLPASVLLLAACAAASAQAPFVRQVYSCYTSDMTFQELACAGVTYVSHVGPRKETADEAHRWGIKVMPYVSLYKVIDTRLDPGYLKEPFWKEVDLAQHPTWALFRPDGKVRLPFDDPEYPKGIFQSCCNQAGIADAYVRGVENVLAAGNDGVFVDNVHPFPRCHGPELGLHQHLDPAQDNTAMYKAALMRVFQAVKAHGPAFMVMLNSGGPSHAYAAHGDSLMWESFVFRWPVSTWKDDLAGRCRMDDWPAVLRACKKWEGFTAAGGSIAPLTYLPIRDLEKPHAYLAYVCAKLCGFQQWTGTAVSRQDILRQLYRTDLGMPAGALETGGPLYCRLYEKGIVVGNPAATPTRASVPWPLKDTQVMDLYTGEAVPVQAGRMDLELPADSGRVYVSRAAYLANVMGEAAGMAQSCALHLEKAAQRDDEADARLRECLAAFKAAGACLQNVRKRGVPVDEAARRQIARLPDLLKSDLAAPKGAVTVESRLLKGEVPAADLPELFKAPGKAPFAAQAGEGDVRLRSGGAEFLFRNEGKGVTISLGEKAVTLWVGADHAQHGWMHARAVKAAKLVKDTAQEKSVEFTLSLYGSKSGQDVPGFDVAVRATIRAGIPAISLHSALRNHTEKPVPAYWFWCLPARYHTFPGGKSIEPKEWGEVKEQAWDYLHAKEDGGGGLVLADFSGLGYGQGQANPRATPHNQTIPAGGEMPVRFTANVVAGPAAFDGFLGRRRQWYVQYASLAASVVTGVRAAVDAPAQAVPGATLSVRVKAAGPRASQLAAPHLALRAQVGERELVVTPGEGAGAFTVQVPADLPVGRTVELHASLRGSAGGVPITFHDFAGVPVKPAVEILDLAQAPAGGPGPALVARVRSNLGTPLPITVRVAVAGLAEAPAVAADAPADGQPAQVVIPLPAGAAAPNAALKARLAVSFAVDGRAQTLEEEREVALVPSADCQTAANPPAVDGSLEDRAWKFATQLAGFVDHESGRPAKAQTTCSVMFDDQFLYLGFSCPQEMARLKASARPDAQGLNPETPQDDSVEIYVDPRRPGVPHFRLCLNTLGSAKSSAAGGWAAAVRKDADRWSIELRIPFRLIGATPKTGEVWGLNVCRNDQATPQFSSWSWTQGAYDRPARFGNLRFRTGGH